MGIIIPGIFDFRHVLASSLSREAWTVGLGLPMLAETPACAALARAGCAFFFIGAFRRLLQHGAACLRQVPVVESLQQVRHVCVFGQNFFTVRKPHMLDHVPVLLEQTLKFGPRYTKLFLVLIIPTREHLRK